MFKSNKKIQKNGGMTYLELIVVLGIFATLLSVSLFNYKKFEGKVDIKNLANDIALKVVEAQKSSVSGKLPPLAQQTLISDPSTWKPSFGVYVNKVLDNKSFFYFTDIDQNGNFTNTTCLVNTECLAKISITKGNVISSLDVFYRGDATAHNLNDLTITFVRPSSLATLKSSTFFTSTVDYVQITIISTDNSTALIKLYPSGRIQIN